MSQSPRVTATGRLHWFGEHGPVVHSMEFRHRNVDGTPLVIALGLCLFIFAALIWYCLSTIFRARAKRIAYADHDPEAAVLNEFSCSESGPPFTNASAQHDPGSGQNLKEVSLSTYPRGRSVTLPRPVYDPRQHSVSSPYYGILSEYRGRQHERSRSLSSLSSPSCPLYRADSGSASVLFEQDLHPPPEYSSPPGSPSNSTPIQAPIPLVGDVTARILENGTPHTSIPAPFSDSDIGLLWKSAQWNDFPVSLSQPTIRGISNILTRTLTSPERFVAKDFVPEPSLYAKQIPASLTDDRVTRLFGTYAIFVDHRSGHIIRHLSLPSERITASDSIVTISPSHMSCPEFLLRQPDNRASNGSCDAITAFAVGAAELEKGPTPTGSYEAGHESNCSA